MFDYINKTLQKLHYEGRNGKYVYSATPYNTSRRLCHLPSNVSMQPTENKKALAKSKCRKRNEPVFFRNDELINR